MTNVNIQIKHLVLVTIVLAVFLIAISINNYNMPRSLASKGNNSTGEKQSEQQQQDFNTCVNKSMDKLLNGFLNFSDPDPVSHCFDQFFKNNINNGNATNNNNGGGNNNPNNNSSLANGYLNV
ncbi:MAG: hypothetical protein WA364_20490 [Candidatus Nitrosopolaris sp.]|jgi:hypothetical protein